jgi:hypothetical protein
LLKMEFEKYKNRYQKEHKKTPKSYTFEIEIEWLREFFQIPDSYRFNDIKRNIILKSEKQLREKTDIRFSWKEVKTGKKVTSISITIKKNDKGSSDWLATRRNFIAYIREEYKPNYDKNIFPTIISTNQGDLKLDSNGKLYLLPNNKGLNIVDYSSIQSNKLWSWLYENVKNEQVTLNSI